MELSSQPTPTGTSAYAPRWYLPVSVASGMIMPTGHLAAGVRASVNGWHLPSGLQARQRRDLGVSARAPKPSNQPAGTGFDPMINNSINTIDIARQPRSDVESFASMTHVTDRVFDESLDSPPPGPPE